MDKKTIVTKISPDGERVETVYVNSLDSRCNLVSAIISQVIGSGNILDRKLRDKVDGMIQKTPHYYMFRDASDNYYMVRK